MKTIRIPRVKNIITARPEGMDFETYKALRKEQKKMLHGYSEVVMIAGSPKKIHRPGRLDGVTFRPEDWINSQKCQVVIE
jgi:hypothetical protein